MENQIENITLAAYLEKNPDNKRLNKRFNRALKIYIHAAKDIQHAVNDVAHAREDFAFALQTATQIIEEHSEFLEEWGTAPQEEEIVSVSLEEDEFDLDEDEDDDEDADEYHDEEGPEEEVESHLRHAVKDITNALKDTEAALDCLIKADELLFDIISIAEDDGFEICEYEAKAYVIAKAKEIVGAKAAAAEQLPSES